MSPRVLVTGGGVRLGRAMALAFARAGCDVVVHYHRSAAPAEAVATAIRALGRAATVAQANLSTVDGCRALVNAAGVVDVLINSAAGWDRVPFAELDPEAWDRMQALNLRAPYLLIQGLLTGLRQSALPGGGAVINITDVNAERPVAGYAHYCAAKAGLKMLTEVLALELAPAVRVNAIAPGTVLPPDDLAPQALADLVEKIPLGRPGHADDIAQAAVYLALNAPYVTGHTLRVDGGRALIGQPAAG